MAMLRTVRAQLQAAGMDDLIALADKEDRRAVVCLKQGSKTEIDPGTTEALHVSQQKTLYAKIPTHFFEREVVKINDIGMQAVRRHPFKRNTSVADDEGWALFTDEMFLFFLWLQEIKEVEWREETSRSLQRSYIKTFGKITDPDHDTSDEWVTEWKSFWEEFKKAKPPHPVKKNDYQNAYLAAQQRVDFSLDGPEKQRQPPANDNRQFFVKPENISPLIKLLAKIIQDKEEMRRIVTAAGMDTSYVKWSDRPISSWFNILEEAKSRHKVSSVIAQIYDDYPDIESLVTVIEW